MKTIQRLARYLIPAGILSVTTLLSYITGLLRDRTFAHAFGAGTELDIYNTAFIVPDLLLNIFVASALSPVFTPLLSGLRAEKKHKTASHFATTVTVAATCTISILALIVGIFMPTIAQFIAPGFSPEARIQLVTMSRIILISPVLMALSNSFGSILISSKQFLWYGISPVVYNLGLICGSFLVPTMGVSGLAVGVIFGAMLHLGSRAIGVLKSGFIFGKTVNMRMAEFKQLLKLMGPKMLGHPVEQLKFFGFNRIATALTVGSVTAISFSRNFQSVPVALFGISFAVSAFPLLAEAAALKDRETFKMHVKKTALSILAFTIPSTLFLLIVGDLPIKILLGGGKFVGESITRTATALAFFSLSIPTESLIHLFARSFYALKNTTIPVIMSVTGLVISVTIAHLLAPSYGLIAVPIGFFAGTLVESTLLGVLLYRRTCSHF